VNKKLYLLPLLLLVVGCSQQVLLIDKGGGGGGSEFATTWNYSGRAAIGPLDDNSGNNNTLDNATSVYNATYETYSFNGNETMVSVLPGHYIGVNDSATICTKQYIPSNQIQTFPGLLSKQQFSSNRYNMIYINSSGQMEFIIQSNNTQQRRVRTTGSIGNQISVTCAVTTPTDNIMYLNGVDVSTLKVNTNLLSATNENVPYTIGGQTATSSRIIAEIYYIYVWNRSLNSTEILSVYNNQTISNGLVTSYPFRVVSSIPSGEYASLVVPVTPEPPSPVPGTFWRDWDTNETYIRTPAATWQVVS